MYVAMPSLSYLSLRCTERILNGELRKAIRWKTTALIREHFMNGLT